MELLILLNIFAGVYLVLALYRLVMKKNSMSESSHHHLLSHFFIVLSATVSMDVFIYKGWVVPMVFAFAYLIQHTLKEDIRLIKMDKWTP